MLTATRTNDRQQRNLELVALAQSGDQQAANDLIVENEGLIGRIVGLFIEPGCRLPDGLDEDELMQVGRMAVLHCIGKFDVSRGFQFSTYAYISIRRNITRRIVESRRRESREMTSYDFYELAQPEPCGDAEEDSARVRAEAAAVRKAAAKLSENQASLFGCSVASAKVRQDWMILCLYYKRGWTLQQIADRLGVSKERVRQKRQRAIERIRKAMGIGFAAA